MRCRHAVPRFALTVTIVGVAGFLVRDVSAQGGAIVWNPNLALTQLTELSERLQKPEHVDGLQVKRSDQRGSRHVTSCLEYLSAVEDGYFPESTTDVVKERSYVQDCYILRDLRTAQPARVGYVPIQWLPNALNLLPPLLARPLPRGEDTRVNPHPELGWAGLPDVRWVDHTIDTLSVEDDEQIYTVVIVGRADFNGDTVEDLAIAGFSRLKEGSFRQNEYYVLTQCEPNARLRIISAAEPPFRIEGGRCL